MKVILRNPRRELEVSGKRRVKELLKELDILPSTVLVIRRDELLTGDTVIGDDDGAIARAIKEVVAGRSVIDPEVVDACVQLFAEDQVLLEQP